MTHGEGKSELAECGDGDRAGCGVVVNASFFSEADGVEGAVEAILWRKAIKELDKDRLAE